MLGSRGRGTQHKLEVRTTLGGCIFSAVFSKEFVRCAAQAWSHRSLESDGTPFAPVTTRAAPAKLGQRAQRYIKNGSRRRE